jgi:hypothetical protein
MTRLLLLRLAAIPKLPMGIDPFLTVVAWKATPRLRDYLRDLELDAEADHDDF